jgi:general L-amino acid transport system permease protein
VTGAPRLKSIFWQGVVLLTVMLLAYSAATNAYDNLQRQHVAVGWGFLENTAGFAISQTLIAYSEVSSYGRAFVVGLLNTLLVAAIGIVCATVLGFVIGVARLSHNWLVNRLALCYVELIRNIPLVLQLMFWYRAVFGGMPSPRDSLSFMNTFFLNGRGLFVPTAVLHENFSLVAWALVAACTLSFILWRFARNLQARTGRILPVWQISLLLVIGLPVLTYYLLGKPIEWNYPELVGFNFTGGTRIIPEFVALLLGLVLYTASFIAEIVRAGIQAVAKGQMEAALALGLSRNQAMRLIVLPQALRVIIPPLTSQYLNLTKNSSLAVAIGYPDLFTVAGTINNQTGQAIEVIVLTMAVYLTLSLLTSAVMNLFNARFALVER